MAKPTATKTLLLKIRTEKGLPALTKQPDVKITPEIQQRIVEYCAVKLFPQFNEPSFIVSESVVAKVDADVKTLSEKIKKREVSLASIGYEGDEVVAEPAMKAPRKPRKPKS